MNEKAIVYKLRLAIVMGFVFTILYANKTLAGASGMRLDLLLMATGIGAVVFTTSFAYFLTRYVVKAW